MCPTAIASPERLLVFNCHEAWVYQLSHLPREMDVVVGLKGRYTPTWDARMRPVPKNARLVRLEEVLSGGRVYDCIIAHNITDLLDAKPLPGPRLLVLHSTLEGRKTEEGSDIPLDRFRETVRAFLGRIGGHAVACSSLKARSWGITDDVVTSFADPADYPDHTGQVAAGLRICNHINRRRKILLWDFHEEAFAGLPLRLVGHNPDMPDVSPARDWEGLKLLLQAHRFYVHTADPRYEDGYNMAMLEAMAAGLPVVGNRHPSSPITDGVDGFLSDDPMELRSRAEQLLSNPDLADRMGQAAREKVRALFPKERFVEGLMAGIDTARRKWSAENGSGMRMIQAGRNI